MKRVMRGSNGVRDVNFDVLSFIFGKLNCGSDFNDVVSYLLGKAISAVWTTIRNVAIASFTAVPSPLKEFIVDITPVQSGSGDPSPDNVRPISGWDAVRYIRSADAGIRPKVGAWTGTTGSLVFDGKTFHRNFTATATALNLIPSAAVPEVLQGSAVAGRYYCHLNYSGTKSVTGIKFEFTTPDGTDYVYIDNGSYGTVKSTFTFRRVFVASIEGGGFSAGDYFDLSDLVIAVEPDTASISLGQTVYGGTLEWLGGNQWKISNTVRVYNLADLDWDYVSNAANPYFRVVGQSGMVYADSAVHLCNCYKYESIGGASTMAANSDNNIIGIHANGNQIYVRDTRYTDAASLVTFLASVSAKFIIEVSTATEYTVTVPDSEIKTLLGSNNIFADCGNINTITYRER